MGKIKHLTPKQKERHELAVRLRKMTDEQLVTKLFERWETDDKSIARFLETLEGIHGIGTKTIDKLREFARENGYI